MIEEYPTHLSSGMADNIVLVYYQKRGQGQVPSRSTWDSKEDIGLLGVAKRCLRRRVRCGARCVTGQSSSFEPSSLSSFEQAEYSNE